MTMCPLCKVASVKGFVTMSRKGLLAITGVAGIGALVFGMSAANAETVLGGYSNGGGALTAFTFSGTPLQGGASPGVWSFNSQAGFLTGN